MIGRDGARRRTSYDRWFGPTSVMVAWTGLCLALVHPPHGLGFRVCWTSFVTNFPCPGCGLTRSLSSAARGLFAESWQYHPFGMPLLVLFALTVVMSLLPARTRRRFAAGVLRNHRSANRAFIAFVVVFTAYGVMRSILHLIGT